jgi:hypothetical protein
MEWAATYGDKIIRRLEVDVFPWIGREPVGSVTPVQLLEVLRRIEARGAIETAHRALENCGQVFRYAVATGRVVSNPARDLKDALRKPLVKHFPAITDPNRLGELLRACDNYQGTHVVRAARRLAPMLLLRPGELRHARWEEFDLDAALWLVPAARMKQGKAAKVHGKPHAVPLPNQAVHTVDTGVSIRPGLRARQQGPERGTRAVGRARPRASGGRRAAALFGGESGALRGLIGWGSAPGANTVQALGALGALLFLLFLLFLLLSTPILALALDQPQEQQQQQGRHWADRRHVAQRPFDGSQDVAQAQATSDRGSWTLTAHSLDEIRDTCAAQGKRSQHLEVSQWRGPCAVASLDVQLAR